MTGRRCARPVPSPPARPLGRLAFGCGISLLAFTCACGDLSDAVLESVSVEVDGEAVQTLPIAKSGSNFFADPVAPEAIFVIRYDEPVDLDTAREHIRLEDANSAPLSIDVGQQLTDLVVAPAVPMQTGQNHVLVIEGGIDDASGNTDQDTYVITLYVDEP